MERIMTKQKKQTITILVLLLLLILLGGAYLFAGNYQKSKEKKESSATKSVSLYKFKENDIMKLHYKNSNANITFVKEKNTWKMENDKDFPVDQSKVETMVSDMAAVTASRQITKDCNDLSEYALDSPSLVIELTDKNGKTESISYGLESAAAEGCYAYTGDNTKEVYVVPSNVTDDFSYTQAQLMTLPDTPDISAQYVTSYEVDKKKGTNFLATYDNKKAKYKDIYGWDITKAYDQTVAGDEDGLQTVFSALSGLEYTEGVVYHATKKEEKQYGISNPKYTLNVRYYTVNDTDDDSSDSTEIAEKDKTYHTFKLLVGNLDDTQQNYYVQPSGSNGIYLVSADTIASIAEFEAFSCVYKTPCPANTDSLKSLTLNYQGKKYTMTLDKEEKPSTSSSKEYNYTSKVNGKKVSDKTFRKAYEALGNITYSAAIKSSVKPSSDTPVATLQFAEDNKNFTVSFLPYDGSNFYRVKVNDVCLFVADMTTVDSCLKDLAAVK